MWEAAGNEILRSAGMRSGTVKATRILPSASRRSQAFRGSNNVAAGSNAGEFLAQGDNNIIIGFSAGKTLTNGSGNIYIGSEGADTESDTIRIGSGGVIGQQHKFFVAGVHGIVSANSSRSAVYVDNAGQLGVLPSSRRYKDDITDMDTVTAGLMRLRPVTFHYKSDRGTGPRNRSSTGWSPRKSRGLSRTGHAHARWSDRVGPLQFLPSMLLNEYQKQQRTIQAQADTMSRQAAAMTQQARRIAELEQDRLLQLARIDALESQAAEIALLKQQMTQIARRQGEDVSAGQRGVVTAGDVSVTRSR